MPICESVILKYGDPIVCDEDKGLTGTVYKDRGDAVVMKCDCCHNIYSFYKNDVSLRPEPPFLIQSYDDAIAAQDALASLKEEIVDWKF